MITGAPSKAPTAHTHIIGIDTMRARIISFEVRTGLFGTMVSARQYGQEAKLPAMASRMCSALRQLAQLKLIIKILHFGFWEPGLVQQ
jgi:hypothetical protein